MKRHPKRVKEMFDIWSALIFLGFALPISLLFMGFLGWVDSKQQERKREDVDIRK